MRPLTSVCFQHHMRVWFPPGFHAQGAFYFVFEFSQLKTRHKRLGDDASRPRLYVPLLFLKTPAALGLSKSIFHAAHNVVKAVARSRFTSHLHEFPDSRGSDRGIDLVPRSALAMLR